jgi:hypothetical protein
LRSYPVGQHDKPTGRAYPLKEEKVLKAVLLCIFGNLPMSPLWINREEFESIRQLLDRPGINKQKAFKALVDTFRPSSRKGSASILAPVLIPIVGSLLYYFHSVLEILPTPSLIVLSMSVLGWSFFDLDISRTGLPLYMRFWSVWLPQALIAFALSQWFSYLDGALVGLFVASIAFVFLQSYAYSIFIMAVVGYVARMLFLAPISSPVENYGSALIGIIINILSTAGLIPLTLHCSWALPHILLYSVGKLPFRLINRLGYEFTSVDCLRKIYDLHPEIRAPTGLVRFAFLLHLYTWNHAKRAFRYPMKLVHHMILAWGCIISAALISVAAAIYSFEHGPIKFW